VVVRDGLADYAWTRNQPDPFPQWSGERMRNIRTALGELARFAQDQGVILVLQNHAPVIKGHRDVYDLIEQVGSPALKACIDLPADTDVATDPAGALSLGRKVGGTMVHAHYFGQFKRGAHDEVELDFDPPFAYPAYVQGLVEAGYAGYMNWEFLPACGTGRPTGRHRLRARADRAGPLVHAAIARGGGPVRRELRRAALRQARSMAAATRLADRVAASIPQFRLSA
jgi:sugar phosphate isomerase/epimerase